MEEFRLLNYHTEYSCSGTFNKKMDTQVCFSQAFHNVRNNSSIQYIVRLYPDIKFVSENHKSNMCVLNRNEIKNHLRQLTGIFPFEYRVVKTKVNNYPCYEVHIHLCDVPATFHKYVLTWIRYSYEFPYNVILKDTYMLKKDPMFRFTSISNLFNVVSNCYPYGVGEGHSIFESHIHIPLKKAELRDRIKEVDRLNYIYQELKGINKMKLPAKIKNFSSTDIEYWSPEFFEMRKNIYINMYNQIKAKR